MNPRTLARPPWRARFAAPVAIAALAAIAGPVAAAGAQGTERVSLDSAEVQANDSSSFSALSADGRYVAFSSSATNLVAGDTNNARDVFVRDRQTGVTERVSIAGAGTQANGAASEHAISADGRHVAFVSSATNLVPGDTNQLVDVFLHDRQTGETELVSVGSAENQANGVIIDTPSISADGRHVVFSSVATNLVPGDLNGSGDVFVRDRQAGSTERVSIDSSAGEANDGSSGASISADGRYVAFDSAASDLVAGDTNFPWGDVFVHDRQSGLTERVSVASSGSQGDGFSRSAAISADGRYVAFSSYAKNFVAGDTNQVGDVFVHDRQTDETERVSVDSAGAQADDDSVYRVTISADGRHVAFTSLATNLVAGDTNNAQDVFVRDRESDVTERVSVGDSQVQADSGSIHAWISADGRFVSFASFATNLVPGDTNAVPDVFVRDRGADFDSEYATLVLGDKPAGYWRFGEPFGSTELLDSSPNANHGVYQGDVALGAIGIPGNTGSELDFAAVFDGIDDFGRVPDDSTLDVGASFSAEGWICRCNSSAKTHQLMNKGQNGLQLVVMNAGAGNQVYLRKTGVTTIARSNIAGGVPAGLAWHHVVATMDGTLGSARIYIDGVEANTVQVANATIQNTAFGLLFATSASTQASYDEFALYDDVLTAAEVAEHYAVGSTP